MKTNSTIGKLFMAAFAFAAIALTSCKEDETPAKDISGKYVFTSATLIDGDISNSSSTDLVVLNASQDANATPPYSVTLPAGESATTSYFVNFVLAGAAPCTSADPTSWKYDIDLKTGGILAFDCTSESLSDDLGTWALTNNTKLSLTISSAALGTLNININDLVITDTTITGTVESFPMVKDATQPIGASNVQFISFDITITKI